MIKKSKNFSSAEKFKIGALAPRQNFSPFTGLVKDAKASTKGNPETLRNSGVYIALDGIDSEGQSIRSGLMSAAFIGASSGGKVIEPNRELNCKALIGKVVSYDGTVVSEIRQPLPEEFTTSQKAEEKEEDLL